MNLTQSAEMENIAAFVMENRRMEIQPIAMPVCKENEVLVQIGFCGICGSDLHFYAHGEPAFPDVYPFVLGHELAGGVVEVGSQVTSLKIGDRVAIEPGVPCYKCEWCKSGKYNLCPHITFLSAPRAHGGLRKYVAHPADLCFKLPDSISTREGALIEPLAVGLNACINSGVVIGKTVAILGVGCIGLITLLCLRSMGIDNIAVADLHENRLEKAKALGAVHIVNASKTDPIRAVRDIFGGYGPDFVFETAGAKQSAGSTIDLTKRGGTIVLVGNVVGQTPLDLQRFVDKELTMKACFRYRNVFPVAIEAIAKGRINVKQIISSEYNFTDSMAAFEAALNEKQTMIKAVIKVA